MAKQPLKLDIVKEGQRFVDEPVYREVSRASALSLAVNAAMVEFSRGAPGPRIRSIIREITHYNRVSLRWMKPDGKGGVVPKYPERG